MRMINKVTIGSRRRSIAVISRVIVPESGDTSDELAGEEHKHGDGTGHHN